MPRLRIAIFISTIIIVGIIGTLVILYARGYRLTSSDDSLSIGPTGLLVANSDPTGGQVFVNGELETATDNTISLAPNTYDIEIKKEGYLTWSKRITIERETVTQIDAFLLPQAPSLSAITFSGVVNPAVSQDLTKVAYVIPPSTDTIEKAGLWVMETTNLPLGFNRDPRQVTDGDLTEAEYEFSPDGRQILLTTSTGTFLLEVSELTTQSQRINIASTVDTILEEWELDRMKKLEAQIGPLADEIESILARKAVGIRFSPDENRILYTASGSATIPEDLIPELPGSSTQEQNRTLQDGLTYVYDIREDRNFKVGDSGETLYWLPNSLNLVIPEENKINVMDYDGTNRVTFFSGSYVFPHAYPSTSANRILILTNFGSSDSLNNMYWLGLK